jgi:hypothetical protein
MTKLEQAAAMAVSAPKAPKAPLTPEQKAAKKAAAKAKKAEQKKDKVKLYDNGKITPEQTALFSKQLKDMSAAMNKSGMQRSADRLASIALYLETRGEKTDQKAAAQAKKLAKAVAALRKLAPGQQLEEILKAAKAAEAQLKAEEAKAAK